MSGAGSPTSAEAPASLELDDKDVEPRTPMKRLGSTRKLAAFANIRMQLNEQRAVLEARAEATQGVLGELGEYCRRRAELEHEYARALDKLAKAALQRHKDHKHKRAEWELSGAHSCWQAALDGARALARDHAALAALHAGPLAARLQRAQTTHHYLHRKSRDIVVSRHEEVISALVETAATGKLHARAAAAARAAADKLRRVARARDELLLTQHHNKKLKAIDKHLEKRRERYNAAQGRALRARADYVLSVEAANATLQRYYHTDIQDIMLCSETGVSRVVSLATQCMGAAGGACAGAARATAAALSAAAGAVDANADQQRVTEAHARAFHMPAPLVSPEDDTPPPQELRAALAARLIQLDAAAHALRLQTHEAHKTLLAAQHALLAQLEGSEESWDVSELFGGGSAGGGTGGGAAGGGSGGKGSEDTSREQEDYYLQKFRGYMWCAGRLARLEGKAGALRERLLGGAGGPGAGGAGGERGQFAQPLSGDELPPVLTACIRVIAKYGMKQQGVFRVSGSVCETAALRAALDAGEDALQSAGAAEVHAVCALLKQYLRALVPPPLPAAVAARLLPAAALNDEAFVTEVKAAMLTLPRPSMLLLRYLFGFLHHLTEYSAYNMMDAWNLAICFGPTLLPGGGGGAATQLARQNLGNELLKRVIIHHARLFPADCPHALYRPQDMVLAEDEELDPDTPPRDPDQPPCDPDQPPTDETDAIDALSLYKHDDTESEDSDEESGEWNEDECALSCRRSLEEVASPPHQETEPAPADPASPAAVHCSRLAESTPDLVLDLPARSPALQPASPSPGGGEAEGEEAGTADTFLHNRDTLKKKTNHKHSLSEGNAEASKESTPEPEGSQGSPVPARNTARVCAQFAALTLTGGARPPAPTPAAKPSLPASTSKPSLPANAAKPALLRRPTPHPHRPSSQPDPAQ